VSLSQIDRLILQGLNSKNMYNGCNLLRVDFSKLPELSVRFNNDKTRDFTNPLLPSGDSQAASSTAQLNDQRTAAAASALAAVAQQGSPTAHLIFSSFSQCWTCQVGSRFDRSLKMPSGNVNNDLRSNKTWWNEGVLQFLFNLCILCKLYAFSS